MARNKTYTCDRCGAQFDEEDGFSLGLYHKSHARRKWQKYEAVTLDFDLCVSCASAIADEVRDVVMHHAEEKEVLS
jgi:predicted RNA-binding Zn-ribbon protein involved in translation (DUF1610 family)